MAGWHCPCVLRDIVDEHQHHQQQRFLTSRVCVCVCVCVGRKNRYIVKDKVKNNIFNVTRFQGKSAVNR